MRSEQTIAGGTDATEMVTLCGDLTVSLPALRVLWDLEARGFSIVAEAGGLVVSPRSKLTATDDAAIHRCRDELLALVRYCETAVK